jgi:hypothetical protein
METTEQQEQQIDCVETYFIYLGEDVNGRAKYACIDDLSLNDGSELSDVKYGKRFYDQKLFKKNNQPGSIFKVKEKNNRTTVSYDRGSYPVDTWKNQTDRVKSRIGNQMDGRKTPEEIYPRERQNCERCCLIE